MKIRSGHLTLIIIVGALLGFAHLHQEDIIQLVQVPQTQQETVADLDLQPIPRLLPTPTFDNKIVEYRSQCWWPEEDLAPRERELIQVDGTVKRVTEPVWRQTIQAPRAISAIEIVDSSGNRWRLVSGAAQKGVQLTGRIHREDGQTYFVNEDANVCYGRWLLVATK
jgi:hypothetical protein|tara:strand:+ start:375 stop:875 length:501 start_codon:yes stop_codon:yes gene_type:complete